MIPLPGFIYFDPNFKFKDGETGRKLFVVLCPSPLDSDNVLVARTTSKPKSDKSYGCHFPSKYEAVFFLPVDDSKLNDDTWIRYDYLIEYRQEILSRWQRKCELSYQQTKEMLLCASESYTISNWQRDALKELGNDIKI